MEKDTVFKKKMGQVPPFAFDDAVTRVFDDMLTRSVPLYSQNLKLLAKLTRTFYRPGTSIYDMGCSHGNFGITLMDAFENYPFKMIGVDSSRPMIDRYKERLQGGNKSGRQIVLVCDTMENTKIENASVVVVNLTLQFVLPDRRDAIIRRIHKGLIPGGVLLLTEKTVHSDPFFQELQTEFYCSFKRENGYSDLEISQKRDALEKVLIPDTIETHEKRIKEAGFVFFETWLKWFNFAGMIAFKGI